MRHPLLAWCAGSLATCATAAALTALLPLGSEPRAIAVAEIQPEVVATIVPEPAAADSEPVRPADDGALAVPPPAHEAWPIRLAAADEGDRTGLALLFRPPDGPSGLPSWLSQDAGGLSPASGTTLAPEPAGAARAEDIMSDVARQRDPTLVRALVRPPPRPPALTRLASLPDGIVLPGASSATDADVVATAPGMFGGLWDEGAATGRAVGSGLASWYGPGFHGRRTASGERFDQHALTAAHRWLPFGTRVRVVNPQTGRSVIVRINDRGPYAHGRVIDLSKASAEALGLRGVGRVQIVSVE